MRSGEYEPHMIFCQKILENQYSDIGLRLNEDSYEYPLWYMLKGDDIRIEHVFVGNESAAYTDGSFIPDCIIWVDQLPDGEIIFQKQRYEVTQEYPNGYYFLEKTKDKN